VQQCSGHGRGTLGAHVRLAERLVERITGTPAGLRHEVTVQIDGGRDGPVAQPSGDLGDRNALGERSAGERMPQIIKCGVTDFSLTSVLFRYTS
jgi:hypothetical protein